MNAGTTHGHAVCPWCLYEMDAATAIGAKPAPERGDVSMCVACGHPAIFTGRGIETRRPTAQEGHEILNSREFQALWVAWFESRGVRGG